MGWVIKLESDQPITEAEVEVSLKYICEARKRVSYPRHHSKQNWGWHAAVDVNLPEGKSIRLSGSASISGQYALEFAEDFRNALITQGGHHIPGELKADY